MPGIIPVKDMVNRKKIMSKVNFKGLMQLNYCHQQIFLAKAFYMKAHGI